MRALQRWHQLYRDGGGTAIDFHPRADAGTRSTAAETVTFVERLALTRPRPALATLHRLAVDEAERSGRSAPSYATVRQIVRVLDPALVTLALEGPTFYRDKHELMLRRRAERPNQTRQADHTELDVLITGVAGKPDRPWLTIVIDDYSRFDNTALIALGYVPSKTALTALTLMYARDLVGEHILVNAVCPGFVATDLNGHRGLGTAADDARQAVRMATVPADGPTGTFTDFNGPVAW